MSNEQQANEATKTIWRSEPYGGKYIDLSSGNDNRLTFSVVQVGASSGDALGSICPHEFISMTSAIYDTFVGASRKKEVGK